MNSILFIQLDSVQVAKGRDKDFVYNYNRKDVIVVENENKRANSNTMLRRIFKKRAKTPENKDKVRSDKLKTIEYSIQTPTKKSKRQNVKGNKKGKGCCMIS